MKKCPFCKKDLKKYDGNHIYRCSNLENKKEIKFKFIEYNFPEISKKDLILKEYEINLLSLPDIRKKYNIDYKSTIFLLDYWNIKKRNISESAKKISHKKYVKTCCDKYAVDNVSKLDEVKEKKKETFIKHYGVDNIWKSKEYYDWLYEYMINKYGKKSVPNINGNANPFNIKRISEEEKRKRIKKANKGTTKYWNSLSDDEKNKLIQKRCRNLVANYDSKLERRISDILSQYNIEHTKQFWINRRSYDIRINKSRFIIEVQGDFWHGNPNLYCENAILNHPLKPVSAKELWESDLKKRKNAEKYNYSIIYLWEFDINKMSDEEIFEIIINYIENE